MFESKSTQTFFLEDDSRVSLVPEVKAAQTSFSFQWFDLLTYQRDNIIPISFS